MKNILSITFLICIGSLTLFSQSKLTDDSYAIHNAILGDMFRKVGDRFMEKISFVVLDETVTLDYVPPSMAKKSLLQFSNEKLVNYPIELRKAFEENNRSSAELEKQEPTDFEYYLVSPDEIEQLLALGRKEFQESLENCKCIYSGAGSIWQPIRRKYPKSHGVYKFSRSGFSSDKKSALIFLTHEAGDLGEADFYFLEKVNDIWKIRKTVGVSNWIS